MASEQRVPSPIVCCPGFPFKEPASSASKAAKCAIQIAKKFKFLARTFLCHLSKPKESKTFSLVFVSQYADELNVTYA